VGGWKEGERGVFIGTGLSDDDLRAVLEQVLLLHLRALRALHQPHAPRAIACGR
jgi:hypothetical protein